MRRIIIMLLIGLVTFPEASVAKEKELNDGQLRLRTELLNFLKEEGFMPELDSEGDVKFKSEGAIYYFSVSDRDENPMFVSFFREFSSLDEYPVETLVMATRELNLYKGVKVLIFKNSFRICAELYVKNAEAVKSVFYQLKGVMESVKSDILDECAKVGSASTSAAFSSDVPFVVTQVEVANVEKNGDIIQGYGSTIYDYKTKYLRPKLTVKSAASGSYTVYVRLYKDNVLQRNTQSSPEDYTYSEIVKVGGMSGQTIELIGWGSESAGIWTAGSYRYEVWYNGYCVGSKTFKVI